MGTGYTRNDTGNNIADGNVINASDLDGEFDAVQAAFNGSTGHSHDGTTGEGPQIDTAGIADDAVTGDKIDSTTTVTAASFVGPLTGNVTGNASGSSGSCTGNAATATAWATGRSITLSGAVTGSATGVDGSGNVAITTTATSDPTITLAGDLTGSVTLTNLGNGTLTAAVVDDSHNHVISNVDGLQTALDGKQPLDADLTTIGGLAKTNGNFIVGNGTAWVAESGATARASLGLGGLATLSTVNASTITDNSVNAAELNVSGNGTSGQYLTSDGDGSFSWTTLSIPDAVPAGTVMLFVQSTAPTGWTKSTSHNNKALRVVSGTVSSGGNAAFTTAFASYTPSGNVSVSGSVSMSGNIGSTTLSVNQMPSHRHYELGYKTAPYSTSSGRIRSNSPDRGNGTDTTKYTSYTGGGGSHNHSHNLSGALSVNSSSFSGSAKDLAVQYVDVIIATKN